MTEIRTNCDAKTGPGTQQAGDCAPGDVSPDGSCYGENDSSSSALSEILEDVLPLVQKPSRYIGGEKNSIRKNPEEVDLRVALAFPDVYEVGMSHLGLKILYAIVNARSELAGERVFAPWPDLEARLRDSGEPLRSLESGIPLSDFDIVGFSLQYELCGTNILQMLDLGGIPLRARDRGPGDPIILGGGPTVYNPMPLAPFFDAFAIGDGEDLILELAHCAVQSKRAGESRDELLMRWKKIEGVFIPSLHRPGETVSRRVCSDLQEADFPTDLVVPFCEAVHDRVGIEIARGCTRGCRFCQAGMVYRPVRERQAATVLELARTSLESTGWDEISLLSLSSGDYSCIGEVISKMTSRWKKERVAVSLPSLRTETLDREMAEQIKKVRKTGFTLAPEAGTERLRRVINKGNTEEDLEQAVTTAFAHGWQSVKLYFMIGLPTETDEDLDGIIGAVLKAGKWAKGKKINASVSTFVPKSHTPFQWAAQISMEETSRRQNYIRRYFQKGRIRVKSHNPRSSFLEGVIARGDERLSAVIESAYRRGARFDGWDEELKFDRWMEAFEEAGINPEEYRKERDVSEALPWDFIHTGVDREFLVQEWQRAHAEEPTGDCRFGDCQQCGVCDFEEILPRTADRVSLDFAGPETEADGPEEPKIRRFRLHFGKTGTMRFLSHHDMVRTFHRGFRRSGLKLDYSKGFHPQPRLRFSPPVSVGVESVSEYLDFDLMECSHEAESVFRILQSQMPKGLKFFHLREIALNESPISGKIRRITYELTDPGRLEMEEIHQRAAEFESSPTFELVRQHKGRTRRLDLKEWIECMDALKDGLSLSIRSGQSGSVNPLDAFAALLGKSKDEIRRMKILKKSVDFDESSSQAPGGSDGRQ